MNKKPHSGAEQIQSLRAGVAAAIMVVVACFSAAFAFSGDEVEASAAEPADLAR